MRELLRKTQNEEMPMMALQAIQELRAHLDGLEQRHVELARQKGASWKDIAEMMGVSRQTLRYRLRARNGSRPDSA